jgi:protein-tyrosine phosphatase
MTSTGTDVLPLATSAAWPQHGVTASGVYVRSDNARNLSSLGWKQAWEYGIRTVLDLRSEAERVGDPPAPSQFEHRRISLFAHFDDDPTYRADSLARLSECDTATKYRSLYSEALDLDCRRFAEALDVLATSPRGVLFHCVGGKDRTGVLAGLLLRLVGVSMDDVEADYIHTEARARGRAESPPIDQSAPAGVITQVIEELGSTARKHRRLPAPGGPASKRPRPDRRRLCRKPRSRLTHSAGRVFANVP